MKIESVHNTGKRRGGESQSFCLLPKYKGTTGRNMIPYSKMPALHHIKYSLIVDIAQISILKMLWENTNGPRYYSGKTSQELQKDGLT